VADLWRRASQDANRVLIHWADLYRELLASVGALASDTTVADGDVRERLRSLVAEHQQRKPPTRAQLVRDHLTLEIRSVRSLLSALMILPWEAAPGHPVLAGSPRSRPLVGTRHLHEVHFFCASALSASLILAGLYFASICSTGPKTPNHISTTGQIHARPLHRAVQLHPEHHRA
jgi:hypothetical protein